ncbi:hypothetical protein [Streptomyces sirii]|uniref:hypothetical protein n=1 Tax=Streptomyces sirii TaxID=3127701 RepID=UPI003D36CB3B
MIEESARALGRLIEQEAEARAAEPDEERARNLTFALTVEVVVPMGQEAPGQVSETPISTSEDLGT